MKRFLTLVMALCVLMSVCAVANAAASDYTIRIYSNSNSTERVTWLINAAKEAGFTIEDMKRLNDAGDERSFLLRKKNAILEKMPSLSCSFPESTGI